MTLNPEPSKCLKSTALTVNITRGAVFLLVSHQRFKCRPQYSLPYSSLALLKTLDYSKIIPLVQFTISLASLFHKMVFIKTYILVKFTFDLVMFNIPYQFFWSEIKNKELVNLPVTFEGTPNQKYDFSNFRKLTRILFTVQGIKISL